MRDKLINYKANKAASKYKSYSDFSMHAKNHEKEAVFKSALIKANKIQRQTAKS